MTKKRKNPYQRLLDEVVEWAGKVKYPRHVMMFRYRLANNNENSWRLDNLYERVVAADQLGFDVVVSACDNGDLHIHYRERVQNLDIPWAVRRVL